MSHESQKNQNLQRAPQIFLWALENSKYIKWRDDDTKKLLLIFADPGCGKSVLSRCIIDEDLRNKTSKRILYHLFKDTSPEQWSAARAISTILHQLFASESNEQSSLIRHALPSYRKIGKALSTTFLDLWSIFTAAVTDPKAGNTICVLDALDECNEQELPELINAIEKFCLHQ